jgi:hypothetical protein
MCDQAQDDAIVMPGAIGGGVAKRIGRRVAPSIRAAS